LRALSQRTVAVERHSSAPVEAVWDLVSRASTWSQWAPFRTAALESEGDPAPDGVGAVRRFGTGPRISRERVVAFEAPHHLGYELLSGLPVRSYRSDIRLRPGAVGGTDISWRSTFETPRVGTGWFWHRFVTFTLRTFSARLARAAASGSGPGPA